MKLKCDWIKFLDETVELNVNNQKLNISVDGQAYNYEIVFAPITPVTVEIEKYKILSKNLFNNIRVKSLSFQSLGN